MIFPNVRISELRRDLDIKRASFERSKSLLGRAVKRKFSPLNILKDHPQLWMGAAMSLLGAKPIGKVLGLVGLGRNGHARVNGREKKTGLLGKLFRFGGRTAVRTVTPMAMSAVKFALRSAIKAFRSRGA